MGWGESGARGLACPPSLWRYRLPWFSSASGGLSPWLIVSTLVTASRFLLGNREAELKPTTFFSLLLSRVFLSFLFPWLPMDIVPLSVACWGCSLNNNNTKKKYIYIYAESISEVMYRTPFRGDYPSQSVPTRRGCGWCLWEASAPRGSWLRTPRAWGCAI